MPLIETKNLCQKYGSQAVLNTIDIKIEKGEVFGLIGPSGAGKTTLLRLLGLIDTPCAGKIYFDGADTDQPAGIRLMMRRRMALVSQKPVVFNMSVYDNVAYGLRCRRIDNDAIRLRVQRTLKEIGLEDLQNRKARTLSGGEMQRLAIARAIVLEPEILLLDELTANLDPIATSQIEETIIGIIRQGSTTIIMATHDMVQGQRLADRIGVLINGELEQTGAASEVFSAPNSREVASFVGVENIIPGVVTTNREGMITIDVGNGHLIETVSACPVGEKVNVFIRPEAITLSLTKMSSSARNSFPGQIERLVAMGPLIRVVINSGSPLVVLVTKKSAEEMGLCRGRMVFASFKATGVHITKRS